MKAIAVAAGCMIIAFLFRAQAEFSPERICKERTKKSLNDGWRFVKGDNAAYSDSGFSDEGWNPVNIPHSASYDAPTPQGESQAYQGVCWYRKEFVLPQARHAGKIFIEFEGAMQIADVWLNGKKLGTHDNSGFTWFSFDITDQVSRTGVNSLAVRLDNRFNRSIPPGDDATTGFPDYYLFSGLYRDVWLVCTEQCFIPLWGQRISVPNENASSASATVRIKTPVTSVTAGNVMARYIIVNPMNKGVITDSVTQSVSANQTIVLDKVCGPIISPSLWAPESPNLYTVYTQLFKDNQLVDDYVERFGVRWYTWTPAEGFALNGASTIIKGASFHQSMGWIQNALPNTRFFKEVKLVKEMGANLIRCAHFPRDPSFYNACDELGMMLMVEVPTWGTNTQAYPDSFWVRLNSCMKEMIEVGYNHPSIITWGLFNEPAQSYSAPAQLPLLSSTAHAMDSTRLTYLADNRLNDPVLVSETDIVGMNYGELWEACANVEARVLNTEYHQGWLYWCFRGDVNDNESSSGYALQRWNLWTGLLTAARKNKLAGACMWSFNDYWSPFIQKPMGVVTHLRIPKAVYYYFRKQWTGVASETPVAGLTATKVQLSSDADSLIADSTDIAIITASLRDANGVCVDTKSGPSDSIPVTFAVSGPADYFGPLTVKANAGKCALIIKSKNTPGAITLSATAPNLTESNSITIISVPADTSPLPFITGIISSHAAFYRSRLFIRQSSKSIFVRFPSVVKSAPEFSLINTRGQSIKCPYQLDGALLTIDTRKCALGQYYLVIGEKPYLFNTIKKVLIAR